MIKKTVAFNPDDPHQMRILLWVESQTNNFSGYLKGVLYTVMQGAGQPPMMPQQLVAVSDSNDDAYMDIL